MFRSHIRRLRSRVAPPIGLAAALAAGAGIAVASAPALLYSPDSLVDTNPSVGYVEPAIAADPANPKILVAAAESAVFSTTSAFMSKDGGYNWRPASIALGDNSMMGDVQVAAEPDGTMYFAVLGAHMTPSGKAVNGLHVFASTDGGDSFRHLVFLQTHGHSYDHEQLAIDDSHSRHRGNIYMTVLYSERIHPQLNACGILRSSDRGHTFTGPMRVIDGWCFNSRPVVLSNGNIVFPIYMNGKPGQGGTPPANPVTKIQVAISKDAGNTFTAPHTIGTYVNAGYTAIMERLKEGRTDFDGDPVPQLAAGIWPATHRDVIYAVWSDMRTGHSRLLFTRSMDGGVHWRTPAAIVTTPNARDSQYQESIAVSKSGVLGIAYLQYTAANRNVNEMFADSTDGGATFSTPLRIQSAPSKLGFSTSADYTGFAEGVDNQVFVGFSQPEHRFPSGGDYVGMTVDAKDTFHPIWADSRTGTYQIWTASVTPGAAASDRPNVVAADVSKNISLQFGAGSWDPSSSLLTIPVSVHNASTHPLYPPFTVTVTKLYDPYIPEKYQPKPWPSFGNADNGQSGVGAVYTYAADTLGNLGVLSPGANSATRVWKIKLPGTNAQPSIMVKVDGYTTP